MKKSQVVQHQLSLASIETVTFDEGGKTVLTPALWAPATTGGPRIDLGGPWQAAFWPFVADEARLAGGDGAATQWQAVQQPGRLFYYDPEQSPDQIAKWNRVSQEHLDEQDGVLIRRSIAIPAGWAGKRILLRFEGIYPAGRIYWDGRAVAEQWSGLTPIEVDVTDLAAPGKEHLLAVRFYRRHSAVRLDMPRHALDFVGLSRTAFVHAVEPIHLSDLRLQGRLADDYATGAIAGDVKIKNAGSAAKEITLELELTGACGKLAAAWTAKAIASPGSEKPLAVDVPAGPVQVWNDERPNLYTLSVRLTCPGQAVQVYTQQVGFRRLEFKDGRPTLNGSPVKFRGVNHLTHHPEHGMYTPKEWLRQCLSLMKRANVNAIRTHLYGPPELAELCDEMGVYLLQELPVDWGTDFVQDVSLLGPMLHRMAAGVRRDRNHPSVMIWSLGNENMPANETTLPAFNEHMRLWNRMVKTVDPTRATMFPPPGPANAVRGIFETRFGDVADIHYSFKLIRDLNAKGVLEGNPRTWTPTFEPAKTREELMAPNADGQSWNGCWFSSEYGIFNHQTDMLHSPFNSIITDVPEDTLSGKNTQEVFFNRLSREWGFMRDDPRCLGGAYFAWIAAGAGDTWGWVRWGEDADWGIVTRDLTPKSVFWVMRALFSPVQLPARVTWRPGETAITLPIQNGYNSIDLSQCTLRTQIGAGGYMTMLREWRDIPMSGAPGTTAAVTVPIWNETFLKTLQEGRPILCRCTILDPTGYRPIAVDVLVFPEAAAEKAGGGSVMPIGPDAK